MAKYYSSTFGKISGKHGNVVAVIRKDGSTYLRIHNPASNPRTDKQQAHRAKFALSSRALVPFNPIFKATMGITNGISTARSYAFKNAIVGEYPSFVMDYDKLMFSFGPIEKLHDVSVVCNEGVMALNWSFEKMHNCDKSDKVSLVVFNKDANQAIHIKDVALRSEKGCSVEVHESWACSNLYLWVYASHGDKMSDSVFVDELHSGDDDKYAKVGIDRCDYAEEGRSFDSSGCYVVNQAIMSVAVLICNLFGLFKKEVIVGKIQGFVESVRCNMSGVYGCVVSFLEMKKSLRINIHETLNVRASSYITRQLPHLYSKQLYVSAVVPSLLMATFMLAFTLNRPLSLC